MKTTILAFVLIFSFVSCHEPETSVPSSDSAVVKASVDTVAKVADSTSFDTLKTK